MTNHEGARRFPWCKVLVISSAIYFLTHFIAWMAYGFPVVGR